MISYLIINCLIKMFALRSNKNTRIILRIRIEKSLYRLLREHEISAELEGFLELKSCF